MILFYKTNRTANHEPVKDSLEQHEREKNLVLTLLCVCVIEIISLLLLGLIGKGIDARVIVILILAGALGGLINFFVKYLELPVDNGGQDNKVIKVLTLFSSKPSLTWAIALIGYMIIGIAGAHLTPLINIVLTLEGLGSKLDNYMVLFGYGILFGFFAIKLLHRSWTLIIPAEGVADNNTERKTGEDLKPDEKVPNVKETSNDASGPFQNVIKRDSEAFKKLVKNENALIEFKDEEKTGADRMMMPTLSERVNVLAGLVRNEWPLIKLRVTESWDENNEHTAGSLHYEARAVDITTSDRDASKLGRLGALAVQAKFDWVYYEDDHIHASTKRDFDIPSA